MLIDPEVEGANGTQWTGIGTLLAPFRLDRTAPRPCLADVRRDHTPAAAKAGAAPPGPGSFAPPVSGSVAPLAAFASATSVNVRRAAMAATSTAARAGSPPIAGQYGWKAHSPQSRPGRGRKSSSR